MNRDFNIITGEIKKDYPINSHSRRFASQTEIKRAYQNGQYVHPMPKTRKLGTPFDTKTFQYGYGGKSEPNYNQKTIHEPTQGKYSLINASKLGFNPISHTLQNQNPQKWQKANRQAPFSKEYHEGRINCPNVRNEFLQRLSKNQFDFHRKKSQCSDMCKIQKSYGVDKLFRKYK